MTEHGPKKQMLTVKLLKEKYLEFQAAAAVRGVSMSALVTQFVFHTIRDVKREEAEEFERKLAELLAPESSEPPEPPPIIPRKVAHPYEPKKKGGRP
jgi:hypothetical protein